ncbi:FG-GAP repeat domain-containing protein [Streptomyces cavernae]|uniref:FG-GAP repeat domain-containing protein n=1 Tax=Streptomyces cavernae TaxID=2259034 RepID=UPI000FEBC1EA|nr:FG-GAP-like repeat-containing protein [Streptomyces cavernae]
MSGVRRRTRTKRLTAPLAAAALVAGGLGAWALTGGAAQAAAPSVQVQDDFNGDGKADLVVGAPNATISGQAKAGYVAVTYGSSSGLSASRKKLVSRSTSGVPGAATAGERFGSTFAKGDLDNDGFGDLVIAGGKAGSVILWGSASGLTGGTNIAGYGAAPQIGDFDGDGKADLALFSAQPLSGDDPVGAPATLWKGPVSRVGKPAAVLNVVDKSQWWGYEADDATCVSNGGCEDGPASITGPVVSGQVGDVNGDGKDDIVQWAYAGDGQWGNRLLLGGGAGFTETLSIGDGGSTPAGTGVGDVNGDKFDDIVVGADSISQKVRIAYGSASGPSPSNVKTFDQDLPGFPGAQESGDLTGGAVSVADVTGDGFADIALGIPGEDFSGLTNAGSVALVRGSASGVTGAGTTVITQNTAGVPGVAETGDKFGVTTALLDVNGNGRRDLAAASTAENSNDGAVWLLRGSSTGLTATSAFAFSGSTLSAPATDALFGFSLR